MQRSFMKKLKTAAIIIFVHAGMELFGFFSAIHTLALYGFPVAETLILPFPEGEMKTLFLGIVGLFFAISRIIAGIGVLKNRRWGLVFSIINCAIALLLSVFMLPFGVVDALCSVVTLSCLLPLYYGEQFIVPQATKDI